MTASGIRSDATSKGGASHRFADARVIQFTPRKRASRAPIVDPLRRLEIDENRRRMQQNLAAAIVVILLTAAGTWLLEELRQSCLEARITASCSTRAGIKHCRAPCASAIE